MPTWGLLRGPTGSLALGHAQRKGGVRRRETSRLSDLLGEAKTYIFPISGRRPEIVGSPKPRHLKPRHLKMIFCSPLCRLDWAFSVYTACRLDWAFSVYTAPSLSRRRLPCGIALERAVRVDVSSANFRAKSHFQMRTSQRNPIFRCPPLRCSEIGSVPSKQDRNLTSLRKQRPQKRHPQKRGSPKPLHVKPAHLKMALLAHGAV